MEIRSQFMTPFEPEVSRDGAVSACFFKTKVYIQLRDISNKMLNLQFDIDSTIVITPAKDDLITKGLENAHLQIASTAVLFRLT